MEGEHADLLKRALTVEAGAQRALLAGDGDRAHDGFTEAATLYRRSWDLAPPNSFGRLVGMVKAAVLSGADPAPAAHYARREIGEAGSSPPSWYALGIAALVDGDDDLARSAADGMRAGSEAFGRAADAVDAVADGDEPALQAALEAIVADFEGRDEHLTSVAIADTALMLLRLAERRGMSATLRSRLLPA